MSTSPAQKVTVVLKPVKTAFTGQIMLLTPEDAVEYEKLSNMFVEYHKPAEYEEELLVQSIIDLEWRCRQIAATEQGLLALGRIELADTTPGHLLPAAAYLKYKREIKDLSLQEHRLHRYREADLKKLQALQAFRKEAEMLRRKMEEARVKQQQQQQPPQPQAAAASAPASQPIHRATVEPLR
jgi:hypothetical protein